MDRLSALTIVFLFAACDESKNEPPPSRVNAAKTTKTQGTTVESFCDVHATTDKAPQLAWPKLDGEAAPAPASTWRWINLWATWCKPCTKELPLLVQWRDKLKSTKPFDLVFVSIDESNADVEAFKKAQPSTPATLRISDSKVWEAWLVQLGLTAGTPIPIHVFVDPKQRVRCVRAGAVREQELPIIEKLLGQ